LFEHSQGKNFLWQAIEFVGNDDCRGSLINRGRDDQLVTNVFRAQAREPAAEARL